MTTTFIYSGSRYINVAKIDFVSTNRDGTHKAYRDDQPIADLPSNFTETIVNLVPVQGEWEVLTTLREISSTTISAWSEPVMAWGLTLDGNVIPITPSTPWGIQNDFALRKKGDDRVFQSDTVFDNEKAWLENATTEAKSNR